MKKRTLACSPFGDRGTAIYPFGPLFTDSFNPVQKGSLEGADALLLWGGTDINPAFYKQDWHIRTERSGHDKSLSLRDMVEWHLCHEAQRLKIPIIGICRGAQLLCCFAGGSLIQDVKGHYSGHPIVTFDGLSMSASANHHQMMNPAKGTYDLLAWAETPGTDHQIEFSKPATGVLRDKNIDPEVLWFSEVKGLAIQPHPEWMPEKAEFVQWCLAQVEHFCFNSVKAV